MNFPRLTGWQQWLLHAFALWSLGELNEALTYWYQVSTHGPYLVNEDGSPVTEWQRFVNHNYYQLQWAFILLGTLPIELNYQLVFKRKPFAYFLLSAGLSSIAFVWLVVAYRHWRLGNPVDIPWGAAAVVTGYSFGYALLRDFIQQRLNQTQQKLQHTQAEITALKAQINPHFFFNTLNTIYGTALLEKADQTAKTVEQLAAMMRYTLTEAQHDYTPVANELAFVADYLQLQRLRLPERETIRVDTRLAYDELPAQIAPLLLIPFVENAFKYGIRMDHPSFVTLQLTVERQQLTMVIENSLFPIRDDQVGLGTGIQNARKRLQLLYPDKHQLSCQPEADRYVVRLHINLH